MTNYQDDYPISKEIMEFHLNDKLLIERCNELTHRLLEGGIGLNTTCKIIKEYQKKYILLYHEGSPALAHEFTIDFYGKNYLVKHN